MIMHVFKHNNIPFEYLTGSSTDGYETKAGPGSDTLTSADQGDGYLTSLTDCGPKFDSYKPHIAVIERYSTGSQNTYSRL